jgi:hypothetical protein
MFVGMYVEKGIGRTAAAAFQQRERDRRSVMSREWLWNEFVGRLSDGSLDSVLDQLQQNTGQPPLLGFDTAPITPAVNWGEDRGSLPRQYQFFSIHDGNLRSGAKSDSTDLFGPLATIRLLSDIETAVQKIPQVDWMWIDLQIGYELAVEDTDLPVWDADEIWRFICQPWSDYLRLSRA